MERNAPLAIGVLYFQIQYGLITLNTANTKIVVATRARPIHLGRIGVEGLIGRTTTPPVAVATPIIPHATANVVAACQL